MTTSLHSREDLLNEVKDLTDDQLSNLLKIIRKEWEEWDALSDEALNNYEAAL